MNGRLGDIVGWLVAIAALVFVFGPWGIMLLDGMSFIVTGHVISSLPYHDKDSARMVLAALWPLGWIVLSLLVAGVLS